MVAGGDQIGGYIGARFSRAVEGVLKVGMIFVRSFEVVSKLDSIFKTISSNRVLGGGEAWPVEAVIPRSHCVRIVKKAGSRATGLNKPVVD